MGSVFNNLKLINTLIEYAVKVFRVRNSRLHSSLFVLYTTICGVHSIVIQTIL